MSIYNSNARANVNIGAAANDGTGDPLRNAFEKISNNFSDLYTFLGNGTHLGNVSQANLGNVTIGNIILSGTLVTSGSSPGGGTTFAGNVTVGNVISTSGTFTSNVIAGNITSTGGTFTGNVSFSNITISGNIVSGNIGPGVGFPSTGVTAGSYGNATHYVALVVDGTGRITAANTIASGGGAQGPQGAQGSAGSSGPQGAAGSTGPQGAQGASGTGSGSSGVGGFFANVANSRSLAVTTTTSNIFIAPASPVDTRYIIQSLFITNVDAAQTYTGEITATLGGENYNINSLANTIPVPVGSAVELLKKPKVMQPSDYINLVSNINSVLHATVTFQTVPSDNTYFGAGVDIISANSYTNAYVATGNSVVLESILLSNDDGTNDVKADVVYTDGSDNILGYYVYKMIVPADATIELLENPKYLTQNHKIRVLANQADRLEVVVAGKKLAQGM